MIPATLQDELLFVGMLGRGGEGEMCWDTPETIPWVQWSGWFGTGVVCLYAALGEEEVSIDVYDANGQIVYSGSQRAEHRSDSYSA